MVYVNIDFSHSRKLSVVSWLPEFNMVDVWLEVHHYTAAEGLSEDVQRLPAHFRLRLSTGDYADIIQHYDDHWLTVADHHKSKWRPVNRKYAISPDWIDISEKFRWLHPFFDHARFTSHTANTVRRRPTTGNQNVYPVTANGLII